MDIQNNHLDQNDDALQQTLEIHYVDKKIRRKKVIHQKGSALNLPYGEGTLLLVWTKCPPQDNVVVAEYKRCLRKLVRHLCAIAWKPLQHTNWFNAWMAQHPSAFHGHMETIAAAALKVAVSDSELSKPEQLAIIQRGDLTVESLATKCWSIIQTQHLTKHYQRWDCAPTLLLRASISGSKDQKNAAYPIPEKVRLADRAYVLWTMLQPEYSHSKKGRLLSPGERIRIENEYASLRKLLFSAGNTQVVMTTGNDQMATAQHPKAPSVKVATDAAMDAIHTGMPIDRIVADICAHPSRATIRNTIIKRAQCGQYGASELLAAMLSYGEWHLSRTKRTTQLLEPIREFMGSR